MGACYENFAESYNRIMSLLGINEILCFSEVVGKISSMFPEDLRSSFLLDIAKANSGEEWKVLFDWTDSYFFGSASLEDKVNVR